MKYWEISSPRPGKEGKTHWHRVGTMFEAKNGEGFNIVFDALPLPDKEGRVSVIARLPRPKQEPAGGGYQPLGDQLDDAVPF